MRFADIPCDIFDVIFYFIYSLAEFLILTFFAGVRFTLVFVENYLILLYWVFVLQFSLMLFLQL